MKRKKKRKPRQVSLHIVLHKIPEGWSGTYEDYDNTNKLIEINPYRGKKRLYQAPYHEFTHWIIDYFGDKFEWQKGWPKKKDKHSLKKDEKEDMICYEVDSSVWEVLSKYLKKEKK